MGLALISFIQNHWPFAPRKLDDLELSNRLVNRLSIPEDTKKFVFAIVEPESGAVVYVLAAQNLSLQSALDAECLIKEVRPDVVVTQVASSCTEDIRNEEKNNKRNGGGNDHVNPVPTSLFGVLKGCFVHKNDKDKYESLAGSALLKVIFGVGLYGHFFAAKKAAEEVGSSIYYVESPFVSSCVDEVDPSIESNVVKKKKKNVKALGPSSSSLVPQSVSPKRLFFNATQHSETLKSLVSAFSQLNQEPDPLSCSVSQAGLCKDSRPLHDYRVPSFAQTVYPLLTDLHSVFGNLPSIDTALAHAQKIFHSVGKGERVDKQLLSKVQHFQIAIEGLRIGLNSAGRRPIINKSDKPKFSELPTEDKSHVLFAHAIRSQTQNSKSIVAIIDASSLAGLRKHWNTSLPPEIKDLVKQSLTKYDSDENEDISSEKKRLIPDKPVVAVGAGASAVIGASSLTKALPASSLMKLVTLKIPASLKPTSVAMKAAASTKNISAVTHGIRAYAQKTSFSAMRTAFYEIMRKRCVQPIGYKPWVKFGCSVSTCAGLLMYGDGVECAVESVPVAPAIASLGRGLENLRQANQVVKRDDSVKVQEARQSLMYMFKR